MESQAKAATFIPVVGLFAGGATSHMTHDVHRIVEHASGRSGEIPAQVIGSDESFIKGASTGARINRQAGETTKLYRRKIRAGGPELPGRTSSFQSGSARSDTIVFITNVDDNRRTPGSADKR